MDIQDEHRIIERCLAGDLAAYRRIYDRYSPPLLRTAQRMLGSPQEAEDAVQETFMKLFRGIGGFRLGARLSTYLFRILNNTCIDALRKRPPAAADDVDLETLGAISSSQEKDPGLEAAVDRLPAQMKACFVLFAVEQFSQEEVADMLGVNVGTVKTNVHRARRKLRIWLGFNPRGGTS
ncbi:MAG: RNA polymerase sigma factor [Candidatus Aminicenantes bacterium]|nr:RNA polymerase sigma factor [Candidatus Aminicenantes bacterium]